MAAALVTAMLAAPPLLYEFRNPRHDPSDEGLHQMRVVAMADDAGAAASQVGLIAAAATALGAAIGALGLWLANRMLGKAAFEAMMTTRFQVMMDQQRAFHAEERASWDTQRLRFEGEIVNLRQTIASLTSDLRRRGVIDIPDNRYGDDPLITIPPGGDAI
jgi:muconolactone delta-isomerase